MSRALNVGSKLCQTKRSGLAASEELNEHIYMARTSNTERRRCMGLCASNAVKLAHCVDRALRSKAAWTRFLLCASLSWLEDCKRLWQRVIEYSKSSLIRTSCYLSTESPSLIHPLITQLTRGVYFLSLLQGLGTNTASLNAHRQAISPEKALVSFTRWRRLHSGCNGSSSTQNSRGSQHISKRPGSSRRGTLLLQTDRYA